MPEYKGVHCRKIEETDTRGCVVVTMEYDDEVTIYDATDDGLLSCWIRPTKGKELVYNIRKSWEYSPVIWCLELGIAIRECIRYNNNKYHIHQFNAQRRKRGQPAWSENTVFFVTIEWDIHCKQYMRHKQELEAQQKKKEAMKRKALFQEQFQPKKRKRGRPKGSKNKPKSLTCNININDEVPIKRKRGRPKGSKNKPKFFY